MTIERKRKCDHTGQYRPVSTELTWVVCCLCGAFQRALCKGAKDWRDGTYDPSQHFPDNAAFGLLSDATMSDHNEAHKIAFAYEQALAFRRQDRSWFLDHCLLPPWEEWRENPSTGDLERRV